LVLFTSLISAAITSVTLILLGAVGFLRFAETGGSAFSSGSEDEDTAAAVVGAAAFFTPLPGFSLIPVWGEMKEVAVVVEVKL
jgi:hypothetical protein